MMKVRHENEDASQTGGQDVGDRLIDDEELSRLRSIASGAGQGATG